MRYVTGTLYNLAAAICALIALAPFAVVGFGVIDWGGGISGWIVPAHTLSQIIQLAAILAALGWLVLAGRVAGWLFIHGMDLYLPENERSPQPKAGGKESISS